MTLDGVPLSFGTVTFKPVGQGATAYGTIAADGTYSVKTGSGQGLDPGEYAVAVAATKMPDDYDDSAAESPLPEYVSPERYADTATSGLSYAVNRGKNLINIELRSAANLP